jgi:hypothetical protein
MTGPSTRLASIFGLESQHECGEEKQFTRKSLPENLSRPKGRASEDIDVASEVSNRRQAVTIPSGTQDYEEAVAILRQKVGQATQPCRSEDFPSVVINQTS